MSTPVWFITAASSGFGKGIAVEALNRGYTVIATARNSAKIEDLKDMGAITADLDVTHDLDKISSIVADLHGQVGRFDVLINAAGYILEGAIEEASAKETFDLFNTNVLGLINATRAFLPYMREQRPAPSHFSALSVPGTVAQQLELAAFGIGVCVVEPGYFRTGFLNPGARVQTQQRIKEYDESAVGEMRARLDQYDDKQPGDLSKGVQVIVDVFSLKVDQIPLRLVLGSDARKAIEAKCNSTLEYLYENRAAIDGTDYPEGE
ncbi:hypothetical protein Q7P37_009311 [Cladosporium fusiforme]